MTFRWLVFVFLKATYLYRKDSAEIVRNKVGNRERSESWVLSG